jgi:hypothetical protein
MFALIFFGSALLSFGLYELLFDDDDS